MHVLNVFKLHKISEQHNQMTYMLETVQIAKQMMDFVIMRM